MDWSALDFSGLANALLALITATIAAVAVAIGRRSKTTETKQTSAGVEISGAAIVSTEPIALLTKELAANSVALVEFHRDAQSLRKAQYQSTESLNRAIDEISDLRQSIQHLTLELARRGR